jgi:hypothetical protein
MSTSTPRRVQSDSNREITRHLEIDGVTVGPDLTDSSGEHDDDNEVAHRWMASHHPGSGYSIVSVSHGRCCRRASYAAADQPPDVDYGAW